MDGDSVRGGSLQARDVHCPQAAGHCEVLSRLYPIGLLHLNDKVLKGLVRCSPVESEAIPAASVTTKSPSWGSSAEEGQRGICQSCQPNVRKECPTAQLEGRQRGAKGFLVFVCVWAFLISGNFQFELRELATAFLGR